MRELTGAERRHVDLDEVHPLEQRFEARLVAELIECELVTGRAQLVDDFERGLITERLSAELEHNAVRRKIANEIQRQELGGDADPRSARAHEVLQPDLAERVDRDASGRERIVDVSLVRLVAGIDELITSDRLVEVEDGLPGEVGGGHDETYFMCSACKRKT